jgi:hypothetical protein
LRLQYPSVGGTRLSRRCDLDFCKPIIVTRVHRRYRCMSLCFGLANLDPGQGNKGAAVSVVVRIVARPRRGLRRFVQATSPAHWDNGPEGNSPRNGTCRRLARIKSTLRQGVPMSSQLECTARAALCMSLAKREPDNRYLWMAEAETWSRLSKEVSRRGWGKSGFGILVTSRARWANAFQCRRELQEKWR